MKKLCKLTTTLLLFGAIGTFGTVAAQPNDARKPLLRINNDRDVFWSFAVEYQGFPLTQLSDDGSKIIIGTTPHDEENADVRVISAQTRAPVYLVRGNTVNLPDQSVLSLDQTRSYALSPTGEHATVEVYAKVANWNGITPSHCASSYLQRYSGEIAACTLLFDVDTGEVVGELNPARYFLDRGEEARNISVGLTKFSSDGNSIFFMANYYRIISSEPLFNARYEAGLFRYDIATDSYDAIVKEQDFPEIDFYTQLQLLSSNGRFALLLDDQGSTDEQIWKFVLVDSEAKTAREVYRHAQSRDDGTKGYYTIRSLWIADDASSAIIFRTGNYEGLHSGQREFRNQFIQLNLASGEQQTLDCAGSYSTEQTTPVISRDGRQIFSTNSPIIFNEDTLRNSSIRLLRTDTRKCRAVTENSGLVFTSLPGVNADATKLTYIESVRVPGKQNSTKSTTLFLTSPKRAISRALVKARASSR